MPTVNHNPFFGAATTIAVTGLGTLANTASVVTPAIDFGANAWLDVTGMLTFTTDASATDKLFVEVYLKISMDGTLFDDDVNDRWITNILISGTGVQTRSKHWGVVPVIGFIPPYAAFRFRNVSGGAFTSATYKIMGERIQSV